LGRLDRGALVKYRSVCIFLPDSNQEVPLRKPAETREKLLQTALGLVWSSNYCSVGVNEICQQAGVTKGAFYHHFDSKADLFYAAACHHRDLTKPEWDGCCSPTLNPLEQLEKLIELLLARQGDIPGADPDLEVPGCPFFLAGGQVGREEEKVRQAALEMAEGGIRYGVAIVRGLKDGGYLEGDPDVEQIARQSFVFVQGLMVYGRTLNSLAAVERDLRDGLYRIMGLKAEYRRPAAKTAAKPSAKTAAKKTAARTPVPAE
jgi:TetR/AcrR family transcriptional repressor of nem operon